MMAWWKSYMKCHDLKHNKHVTKGGDLARDGQIERKKIFPIPSIQRDCATQIRNGLEWMKKFGGSLQKAQMAYTSLEKICILIFNDLAGAATQNFWANVYLNNN